MKTSNKLLIALAISLVGGMFLSNYQLKKKFDTIDTSDPYWEYSVRETGEFHHVKITGGNLMQTKIIRGNKSRLMRKENLKDWLIAKIENDTLFVEFNEDVKVTRQKDLDKTVSEQVIIVVDELRSISTSKANVEINDAAAETLTILAKNNSSIDLKKTRDNSSVAVEVFDVSFFGIYNQNEQQINFKQFDVIANEEATLNLNNIIAENGKIILKDKAKITADASLMRWVVVE